VLIVIYSRYVDPAAGHETALVSRSRAHMVAEAAFTFFEQNRDFGVGSVAQSSGE